MDHFSRLRRNKKDTATPVQASHTTNLSGKTTPPPGNLSPSAPSRPGLKLSPFRGFHLRSSHKRARDSSPASGPHSPTPTEPQHDNTATRPALSNASTTEKTGNPGAPTGSRRPPKMPTFLDSSEQDIDSKFQELVWLERNRLLQSIQNQSPDFRWARMSGNHLKVLDRYMNIQPWQNNRVKLRVPHGQVDYVNASPISLAPAAPSDETSPDTSSHVDKYIAMQGPKQASADHVWRMVVEQLESPGVIVMLTETHESNMEKCFQYFPLRKEDPPIEINAHDEFGDGFLATVRCEEIEETPAGDAIELRKLVVQVLSHAASRPTAEGENGTSTENGHAEPATPEPPARDHDLDVKMKSPTNPEKPAPRGSDDEDSPATAPDHEDAQPRNGVEVEERIIWHFLFKKWPDFGVPNLENLDSFFTLMRLSREKNTDPSNPRIVHCSAGVGRSGTFIALEHLIRELNAGTLENYDERVSTRRTSSESQGVGCESGEAGEASEAGEGGDEPPGDDDNDLIYQTVNKLRKQRRTMVQAESQYMFLYQVLRKLWLEKYGQDNEPEVGEPAAKRLEVDPFVGSNHPH